MAGANLEDAFERITITDENDDQTTSATAYHKKNVRDHESPPALRT
jgi:hypothetical protein